MHDQMGGTWLLRKKPPCATINKCIGIDQKTEKLNRCNIKGEQEAMKLGIVSYAPNFISQCLSLNAHKA